MRAAVVAALPNELHGAPGSTVMKLMQLVRSARWVLLAAVAQLARALRLVLQLPVQARAYAAAPGTAHYAAHSEPMGHSKMYARHGPQPVQRPGYSADGSRVTRGLEPQNSAKFLPDLSRSYRAGQHRQ